MTDRERRQRRLLHVRTLQADLAAAQLRLLRAEHEQDRGQLEHLQQSMHTVVPAHSADWLTVCAERELTTLHASRLVDRIERRLPQLEAETVEEQARRQAREQVQRLCDRTADLTRRAQERTDQARLDDLFSAARSRFTPDPSES